jgi:hypothetical protein
VRRAIAEARERLARHPVATVAIRRSHHIGCLQAYLKPVTDAGIFILLSCSDPNSRTVAPHGGTSPRYSPNPLAVGIPTDGVPILIDISMSTTANGLCQRLAAADEKLPGPWLINREGQPTNDPKNLFDGRGGSIQPLGGTDLGYKGFALGLFVEATDAGARRFFCSSSTRKNSAVARRSCAKPVFSRKPARNRPRRRENRPCACPASPRSRAARDNSRTASNFIRPFFPR